MPSEANCPVCGASHWDIFFEMLEVPIFCNVLWSNQQSARSCARGNIRLAFCANCGFIGNVDFDPARLAYTEVYENSLDFSPHFQNYLKSLVSRLVKDHDLYEKSVIEIGCGKGDFLVSICKLGNNRGVGFDPTYVPLAQHSQLHDQVTFIQDLYSDHYADYQGDFVACRHTLEHIQNPRTLLTTLRQVIGDRLAVDVFFEVPNALDTFHNMTIWDIIYEHCCYFAPVSLAYAFSACGFQVHEVTEEFRGQFLCLEAIPGKVMTDITKQQLDEIGQLAIDIDAFTSNFQNKIEIWKSKLAQIANQKQRVVVWGAGSKGVSFLNLLKLQDQIEYIVDINPRKQGMYVAGTGQLIVPPKFLQDYQPDVVLVMNSIYKDEIWQSLKNLDLSPELVSV
ncbi:MAG: methyltransferase domain-containing protein [Cyanothece sp. SIO1E1]|nr:methyltransferase domain-containing protein [Cyanothece sp. SIO1E1]